MESHVWSAPMTLPIAYLNGNIIPASHLSIAVDDAGFVQGVTVAEQMRTFGGRIFCFDKHLDRLLQSLDVVGLVMPFTKHQLKTAAHQLVEHNHALLAKGDDLGLSMFVTPGPYAGFAPMDSSGPTCAMHTYPVAFGTFAAKYVKGESLVVTNTRQVPNDCWPSSLKCRSRMHYFLADREARQHLAGARALLLDHDDFITEASTANVLIYRSDRGLISPPRDKILPGITLSILEEIASRLEIPFHYQDLTVADVLAADEVLLSSTSPCLLPVFSVNGKTVLDGRPGPIFRQLIEAWNDRVGLDVRAQAERFAIRDRSP